MSQMLSTGSSPLVPGMAGAAPAMSPIVKPVERPVRKAEGPDKQGWWRGTGRRKTAVARVRIKPGKGEVLVRVSSNKSKTIEVYFSELRDRTDAVAPLEATQTLGKLDVICRVDGGGYMGQAQAIRLGVARALLNYDPALEPILRDRGFLTRDAREVERKKYGQAGARRRFQFSKR